jgi:hypothetical protein
MRDSPEPKRSAATTPEPDLTLPSNALAPRLQWRLKDESPAPQSRGAGLECKRATNVP